ncbi:Ubiquitin carboxyl-terminal hydrolase [Entamoeba marina]
MSRYLRRMISSYDEHVLSQDKTESTMCGLYNLGNTCYINSLIQCLAHADYLQQYSLNHPTPFLRNIKAGNKDTYESDISLAFFSMMKILLCGDYSIATPKAFKEILSEKYPQFKGHQQQDCHEFLLILLDELNTSLLSDDNIDITNKICGTPTLMSTSYADTTWKKYITSNNSIITSIFSGQLKQTVTCLQCQHQSSAYDPFNCLSLTIPSISKQRGYVPFAISLNSGEPIACKILIDSTPDIAFIKPLLSDALKQHDPSIQINLEECQFAVFQRKKSPRMKLVSVGKLNLVNYEKVVVYQIGDVTHHWLVAIRIRVIKEGNIIVHHNIPIIIKIAMSSSGKELIQIVKERMKWCGNGEVVITDHEWKQCGYCSEKKGCIGCSIDEIKCIDSLRINDVIYIGYDCNNEEHLGDVNYCESWYISANQRLQTTAVSLFACLTLFTHGDSFETIKFDCEHCKESVHAKVDISIWRPPKILIFHFKRFAFTNSYQRLKTSQHVVFPPKKFDLKEYISNPTYNNPVLYNLYAIVNHEGGIDKGHYFTDCIVRENWFRFSDEKVIPLDDIPTNSDKAYLLFYHIIEE